MSEQTPDQTLGLLRRLLRLGADHPWPVLLLILCLSVIAAFGTLRIDFETGSIRAAESASIDRQTYLHIAREFGSDDLNVVYLRDANLWAPERLLAVRRLHDGLRQQPFVERVESIFSLPVVVVEAGRWLSQPLLPSPPENAEAAAMARERVLANPLAVRHLVSQDGQALAISVAVREDAKFRGDEIHAGIEALLIPLRGEFSTAFQVGPARLQHELRGAMMHDLISVVPVFAGLLWGVTFFFTRSAFAATLPLLVGSLSLLWTAGACGYAGLPFGTLAALLPLLAMLAGTLQILRMASGAYGEIARETARQREPNSRRVTEFMVRDLGLPLILTVLTMLLGFAITFVSNETLSMKDFGVAACLTLFSSVLLALFGVPALAALFAPHGIRQTAFPGAAALADLPMRLLRLMRYRRVFWPALALLLVSAGLYLRQAPGLMLSNDPLAAFKQDHGVLHDAARLQADLAGSQVFFVMLDSNVEGGFREPSNLRRLAEIQAFIAKQKVFDRSHSLADLALQASVAAGHDALPATRRQLVQALMPHSPRDLEPYVSHDWRRANIIVRHGLNDSTQINHSVAELRQAVANYAGSSMVTAVVGENLLVNAAAERYPRLQLNASLALLGMVFLVMSLMYTSLKGGLAALAPGLIPVLLMLGGLQVLHIPLSPVTLVVAILTIGIAMEGSLHLFSRYSALARTMNDAEAAVLETVRREAAPMLAIHLTLAAACLAWLGSDLASMVQFGALTASTLLLSALANLVLMPLLMSHVRLVGLYEILALSMQREALEASPLFKGMSDFQIRKTILISELVEVAQGHCLIAQGSVGRSMFVVVSGSFEVVRHEGAVEQLRATVGPGEVIGEIGFVRETKRVADVRALEPSAALRFDYARLKKDLAYFPFLMNKLNLNICEVLGKRLADVVAAQARNETDPAILAIPTVNAEPDT